MLHREHSGDVCVLASILCKYDLNKGDLFVMCWARVRRVRRGSISSKLIMCGGGVRSILLLPLVARCLETIDVCIQCMFVFLYVVATVWVRWECLLCSGRLYNGCDGCCVFCLYCDACSCSMSVSSCRCYMFVGLLFNNAVAK